MDYYSNYARVLIAIANNPEARMREVAATVGITERAAQRITIELERSGAVVSEHVGRRKRYEIRRGVTIGDPSGVTVGAFLDGADLAVRVG